jgi:transcriptional regulator with XRE-family HTH domain
MSQAKDKARMAVAASTSSARGTALEALRVNVVVGRAKARLSKAELAHRANVSRQTISRIERAATDVGVEVVERIANALGTTIADLFVPVSTERVDDRELARRAATPRESYVDARALLAAVDEAAGRVTGRELERFSRAGRCAVPR